MMLMQGCGVLEEMLYSKSLTPNPKSQIFSLLKIKS